MATSRNNPITAGLRGMIGDTVVFKQVAGKTIITNRPAKPSRQSERQKLNRVRFRTAAAYARSAMCDPQRKEYYRLKGRRMKLPNAYTAAVTAYLRDEKFEDVRTPTAGNRWSVFQLCLTVWMMVFSRKFGITTNTPPWSTYIPVLC